MTQTTTRIEPAKLVEPGAPPPRRASARSGGELASVPGSDRGQVAFNTVVTGGMAVFANASRRRI
jgi:hypothetical protein